jgi:hypothetical protein
MRRSGAFVVAAVVSCLLVPRGAAAAIMGMPLLGPEDLESGFFAGLGVFAGHPTNSYTRVREDTARGTYLYLDKDLGIPVVGEASLHGGWRFDSDDALALAFSYIFIGGHRVLHGSIDYNATALEPGTDVAENPASVTWMAIELQYERELFRFAEGNRGLLALDLGLRLDVIDWRFSSATVVAGSVKKEPGEDFLTQTIPIPVIGLTARIPIAEDWDIVLAARGFRLNHVSSGRVEGGIVYISESFIDATAGLVVRLSPSVQFAFGARYLYVDFDGESREDGNLVGLFSGGAYVTVQITF